MAIPPHPINIAIIIPPQTKPSAEATVYIISSTMCQSHTFHHICGHIYHRTIIQCMGSIDNVLLSASSSIIKSHSVSIAPSPSPSSGSSFAQFSSPSLGSTRSGTLCVDPTNNLHILSTVCKACEGVGEINEWLTRKPEARFEAVRSWKAQLRREREVDVERARIVGGVGEGERECAKRRGC